jgi:hypothetical protein
MTGARRRRFARLLPMVLCAASCASAAERVAVPIEPAPAGAAPSSAPSADAWWSDMLAPLRQFGVESWADVVRFEPWTGSIGITFDNQEQRVRSPGTPTGRFSTQLWSETFTIRNDGVTIVDPALARGSVALGLAFEQQRQQTLDERSSERGTLANYAFDMTALPETAYNLNAFAVRTQNTYVQPSGSRTRSDIASRGIAFYLRETSILRDREILPYFTANVQLTQQTDKQTTTSGGQTFRQDDRRDQAQFAFHNGTETSDLTFQYQFTRLDNFAYEPGSYDSQSANALYSIDFGPTLNWRSDSRLNWYKRTGRTPESDLSTLDFNQFLTAHHTQDLTSSYNYQLNRQETVFGNVTTHSGAAQLLQHVYGNLSMTYNVLGLYSSLPNGTMSSTGAAVSGNYTHALPWEGRIDASGGLGYLVTDNRVPGGAVQVVDAAYRVPDFVGAGARIQLADRNIVASTIVVIVVKGATRVGAVLSVDYTVETEGDRTYVVPSPSSAVMQPGDLLNVSYLYQVVGDSKFRTESRSASIGADWQWFGLAYSHDESSQNPMSGGDPSLLVDQQRDAGSVYVRGVWEAWTAKASASIIRYDSTRVAYRERRFEQYVTWQPYANLQLNLSANQSRTDYELPEHATTNTAVLADLQWTSGGWLTSGYAGWRQHTDTRQPNESILEGGIRVRRNWTKLDLNIAAGIQQRKRSDVESTNGIVHVGVVRRF